MITCRSRSVVALFALASLAFSAVVAPTAISNAAAQDAKPATEFSEQALLDAAYNYCATVENRGVKSCDCEQKLLSQPDRLDDEGKRMAFWYWTNQERFKTEFEARRTADPKWQEGFALKMSNWAALVTAACGA
ncbi:MAG: hypothetical protein NW217_15540 [Hyphomicrobiaceae bacterium]|nr:hypothetical protein [Hyphomicrobiaceae bacterium]